MSVYNRRNNNHYANGCDNGRFVKDIVPVFDLENSTTLCFAGWTNGSGKTFIIRRLSEGGDGEPERVNYVDLGSSLRAAYVFESQLKRDPGLFSYTTNYLGV